ncbi:TRAP transporter large permease [Pseudomonas sp. AU12215]|uniref:TRAP transporter large permease n=1 Tax=Pseudomonas sp. AU12215 TaxID=1860123 RepID=UPI000806830F|nr:TRAP transporter large permease subunit [Pseudomonas sp. AU12215]OBY59303.1 hypothetical protein A9513_000730 [Pseudomonas sp. AU12215]
MSIALVGIGFALMLLLMFLSIPVAVAIIAVGALGGYLLFGPAMVEMMGGVLWTSLNNPSMLAIPLFMLLGELLLRGGMADRMYEALSVWMGRLPGGLLHANIASCALFSATSGSSVATAATVGTIALPALSARHYPVRPSLGSLAAGGTLGILIPPSVNMLVYGSLANVSVGQLFSAGVIPGLLLTLCFSLYIFIAHRRVGEQVSEISRVPLRVKLSMLRHLLAPLIIFGVVMGSIYGGLATPTESAALGLTIALVLVTINGRLSIDLLINCAMQAARTTGMVIIVLTCALMLNVTMAMVGVAQTITEWVASLGLNQLSLLLLLIVFYLLLGMFMDAMSMLVLTVPIAVPMVLAVGVDPIWFGIFIVLMCEIALIHPPLGMNLFVVHGVRRDGGSFNDVIMGSLPYVFVMIGFTLLTIAFPALVTWLPTLMAGS